MQLLNRAYDTDALRVPCPDQAVAVEIPSEQNRKVPIPHGQVRYQTKRRIENLFGCAKNYTQIILRKDKNLCNYAGFLNLILLLLVFNSIHRVEQVTFDYRVDSWGPYIRPSTAAGTAASN